MAYTYKRRIENIEISFFTDVLKEYGYNIRALDLFKKIGELSKKSGFKAFIVGGFVRDLIIYDIKRQKNRNINNIMNGLYKKDNVLDIDFSIEGDATIIAGIIKNEIKKNVVSIKIHKRFKTAKAVFSLNGRLLTIDLATARIETYTCPGALPKVSFADLRSDISRRDFTINTIALSLDPGEFLSIKDHSCGLNDIYEKKLRILHPLSFIDDPTRIFRAVRFEKRFGFTIEPETKRHLLQAVSDDAISSVSGKRIMTELKLILKEKKPAVYFERLEELGILRAISAELRFDEENKRVFKNISSFFKINKDFYLDIDPAVFYMAGLLFGLPVSNIGRILKRLNIGENIEKRLNLIYSDYNSLLLIKNSKNLQKMKKSEVYSTLKRFDKYSLLFFVLKLFLDNPEDRIIKRLIMIYINKLSKILPLIGGSDLKSLKIAEGPLYGEILNRVKLLKIDGKLKTKKEELFYVKNNFTGSASVTGHI